MNSKSEQSEEEGEKRKHVPQAQEEGLALDDSGNSSSHSPEWRESRWKLPPGGKKKKKKPPASGKSGSAGKGMCLRELEDVTLPVSSPCLHPWLCPLVQC